MKKYLIIISVFYFSCAFGQSEGETLYQKGINTLYSDHELSTRYLIDAKTKLKKEKKINLYLDCYNAIFTTNYMGGDFNLATKYLLIGYNEFQKYSIPDTAILKVNLLTNMGILYDTQGNIFSAEEYYKQALSHVEPSSTKVILLANIGTLYSKIKDNKRAINYYLESSKLAKTNNLVSKTSLAILYKNIADEYIQLNDTEKSIQYLSKCESLLTDRTIKDLNYSKSQLLSIYSKHSEILIKQKQFGRAKIEIEKTMNLAKMDKVQFKHLAFNVLARLEEYQKNYPAAREAYQQAIKEVHLQHNEFNIYNVIARQYTNLIALEYKMEEYSSALVTVQKGLSHTAANVNLDDLFTLPDAGDVVYKGEALKILTLKAQILQALYQKSNDQKELQAAYDTYQLAAELAKLIRQDIMTQGSKQKLAGEVLPIYEGGIETALALYKLTKDEQYKNTAFQFAESNKAILLLESMNDNDAKNYSGIPDSLLEKDNQLKIEITFYEKNINQERSKKEGVDEEKIKNWESSLFDLNMEYQALIELLEEQYPKYYELKYATKLTNPQELQNQLLSSSDALIEYFVGEQNIYAFVISKDDFTITTIKKPESFQEDIDLFLYHTKRPGKTDTDFRLSLEAQHDYYVKYVQPAIQSLPTSIKRLIIIPDDVFNYIPFELFITSPIPAEDTRFSPKEHDYLFEQYIMTYNYSATLLQKSYEQKKKGKAENMLLAMAPNFNKNAIAANQSQQRACTIFDIYDLACSDKEVQEISEMMGGDYFIGQDADKATFEEIAKDYRILHLATHSCPDEEDPNFSKIFLADEAITNYDLFNYEFNADLAVLSACNTGFGKLVKGEGVMPLSKGFIQAGIPSTVMSLWPVDDCGTSRMMKLLYQYLDEGLPKDEALQKAKLDFIQNSNAIYQHPYYWSAFIHMGNFEPIHDKSNIPPVVWWIAGGLAILGLFSVSRKRKKQAA